MKLGVRIALGFIGLILLAPGACSAFVLVISPNIVRSDVAIFWFSGMLVGALGVYLLVLSFRR